MGGSLDLSEVGGGATLPGLAPAAGRSPAVHPPPNTINVAAFLSPDYAEHSDAHDGPLTPGEIGTIIEYGGMTGRRFRVRSPAGATWWYDAAALLTGDNAPAQAGKVSTGGHLAEGVPPSAMAAEPEPQPAGLSDSDSDSDWGAAFVADSDSDDDAAVAAAVQAASAMPKARRRSPQASVEAVRCSEQSSPIAAVLSPHREALHARRMVRTASFSEARAERLEREVEQIDSASRQFEFALSPVMAGTPRSTPLLDMMAAAPTPF